jgi:hypothetical protein
MCVHNFLKKPLQYNWRGFFRLIEPVETKHTILYLEMKELLTIET